MILRCQNYKRPPGSSLEPNEPLAVCRALSISAVGAAVGSRGSSDARCIWEWEIRLRSSLSIIAMGAEILPVGWTCLRQAGRACEVLRPFWEVDRTVEASGIRLPGLLYDGSCLKAYRGTQVQVRFRCPALTTVLVKLGTLWVAIPCVACGHGDKPLHALAHAVDEGGSGSAETLSPWGLLGNTAAVQAVAAGHIVMGVVPGDPLVEVTDHRETAR